MWPLNSDIRYHIEFTNNNSDKTINSYLKKHEIIYILLITPNIKPYLYKFNKNYEKLIKLLK